MFIGVRDDGTPEDTVNLETLQQTFGKKLKGAYPPIYYTTKILEKNQRQFLAVIIPGSPERPHFAGKSYIRKGSQTFEASEQQFAELIASRNSKTYEILKWKDKTVSVRILGPLQSSSNIRGLPVVDCNQFYVVLGSGVNVHESHPLSRIEIAWDDEHKRLRLDITI